MSYTDKSSYKLLSHTLKQYLQGGQKVGEKKFPEFSRLMWSHNYTYPEVIATKSTHNNDLHISRVIPYQLLLM